MHGNVRQIVQVGEQRNMAEFGDAGNKEETDVVIVFWDNSCGCFRESTTKTRED